MTKDNKCDEDFQKGRCSSSS